MHARSKLESAYALELKLNTIETELLLFENVAFNDEICIHEIDFFVLEQYSVVSTHADAPEYDAAQELSDKFTERKKSPVSMIRRQLQQKL